MPVRALRHEARADEYLPWAFAQSIGNILMPVRALEII